MRELPAFLLNDAADAAYSFPGDKPAIVCFVKEDCPTCNDVMPVLNALYLAFSDQFDFFIAGQTCEGNARLTRTHQPAFPILDESSLKVSFAYDIDTVPTLFVADQNGSMQHSLVGFVRDEWQTLATELATAHSLTAPDLDWSALPEWRPGCGSLSVDPLIAEKLRAEAENSPLRARRIEIASQDDEFEFMFDQGTNFARNTARPAPPHTLFGESTQIAGGRFRLGHDLVRIFVMQLVEREIDGPGNFQGFL